MFNEIKIHLAHLANITATLVHAASLRPSEAARFSTLV